MRWLLLLLVLMVGAGGCDESGSKRSRGAGTGSGAATGTGGASNSGSAPAAPVAAVSGITMAMDFTLAGGFYGAPFPDENRRRSDGRIELATFPNPGANFFVTGMLDTARRDAQGFGLTSGIFFQATGPLDSTGLPGLHESVAAGASVFLLGVDPAAPDYLQPLPVKTDFQLDGGPYGAPNLLSVIPLQGVPLRPETLYAAVVTRQVQDATGQPLGVPQAVADLANGVRPAGMTQEAFDRYQVGIQGLRQAGVDLQQVAGLTVFHTDRPSRGLARATQTVLQRPLPQPTSPLVLTDVFPEYCVYESTLHMPVYQAGVPPFIFGDGDWRFDPAGNPIFQREEEANLIVTVPRQPMPPGGFPATVLIRTGLASPRPLVTRGPDPGGGGSIPPGSGPALELARAGFMGISVDGPHGGRRNILNMDEQLLIFNFANPIAMRDNIRQSALELVLLGEILPTLQLTPGPGVTTPAGGPVRIDPDRMAIFGHSMGATIAPLALAFQPRYRAAILSGAGGSWMENVIHKQSPLPVRFTAETILGYVFHGRQLHLHDPVLSLLQWAGESADPPVYSRYVTGTPIAGQPRHILMLQGIVDTYILPPIANATSLSLGLDLGGTIRDRGHAGLTGFTPWDDLAPLVGAQQHALPLAGNRSGPGGAFTAVLVQHAEDGIQDGHEVAFQKAFARFQFQHFLETFAAGGAPEVPALPAGWTP